MNSPLLDSIGDPTLTVGLSVPPMSVWLEVGQVSPVLTMAQRVIDYADGDLGKGRMLTISHSRPPSHIAGSAAR